MYINWLIFWIWKSWVGSTSQNNEMRRALFIYPKSAFGVSCTVIYVYSIDIWGCSGLSFGLALLLHVLLTP